MLQDAHTKLQTNSLAWIILRERKAEWFIVRFIPLGLEPQKECDGSLYSRFGFCGLLHFQAALHKGESAVGKVLEHSIVI